MKLYVAIILGLVSSFSMSLRSYGQKHLLDTTVHNLRNGETREWSEFPVNVDKKELSLRFRYQITHSNQTLCLRQYDVKQNWNVSLNNHEVGLLISDEKDIRTCFNIPDGILRDGENILNIKCHDATADDIKVGEIILDSRPLQEVLSEAAMDIRIVDQETGVLIPGRITIVDSGGILQTVASPSKENLAIRPGYVYTGNGLALLHLPAGSYTVYAGRGFEYGIDSIRVELKPGDRVKKTFRIRREVDTRGWVSSDTHVHTFTHSRHGDATSEERAITIAGEGIELPILTDHNVYVDLAPVAEAKKVLSHFIPVVGDEITTKVGHFNIFKTTVGAPVVDHGVENWDQVLQNINDAENSKVIILNHARDIHHGFRPFDPSRHLTSTGTSTLHWKFPANAMEVINSGSQQTDFMNLYHDWFGMLNRGYFLTPVGASDSHDVSRYTIGQGRTYIQTRDDDPKVIDVDRAIKNVREGRVMVSCGLLAKILVNNQYGPGDIVPASNRVNVAVEVHGPAWVRPERVTLYASGIKIQELKLEKETAGGLKWKGAWSIDLPKHDIFLVAVAEGPGDGMPYWPIAKPYQPSSPDWKPKIIGSTGAVWIDADKNGKRDSAYDYAVEIVKNSGGNTNKIVRQLSGYDQAVAMQVAALLWSDGKVLTSKEVSKALEQAAPPTQAAFSKVIEEIAMLRK